METTTNPVVLTVDLLLEEAAETAAYCDEQAPANATLERGMQAAAALALLPEGWTITRHEASFAVTGGRETVFRLLDEDGEERSRPRRFRGWREDGQFVAPGGQASHFEPEEARGRAVVLLLAALDAESRP